MSEIEILKNLIVEKSPEISGKALQEIGRFYEFVLAENQVQNLTRLISPTEFFYGHVLDVLELAKIQYVGFPAMDLGSGVGVPGILAALIRDQETWVLAESEKRKAEYLGRAVMHLDLGSRVEVFSGRAEELLKKKSVDAVVVRAVGTVDKIYSWIRKCSTWNTLVLFKGPRWAAEWQEFQNSKWKKELTLISEHQYSVQVGEEVKQRALVKLARKS